MKRIAKRVFLVLAIAAVLFCAVASGRAVAMRALYFDAAIWAGTAAIACGVDFALFGLFRLILFFGGRKKGKRINGFFVFAAVTAGLIAIETGVAFANLLTAGGGLFSDFPCRFLLAYVCSVLFALLAFDGAIWLIAARRGKRRPA